MPSLSVAEINNPAPEAKAFVWMVDGAGVVVGRASDCSLKQQPPPCLAFSSSSSLPLLLTDTLSPLSVLLMSGGGEDGQWPVMPLRAASAVSWAILSAGVRASRAPRWQNKLLTSAGSRPWTCG